MSRIRAALRCAGLIGLVVLVAATLSGCGGATSADVGGAATAPAAVKLPTMVLTAPLQDARVPAGTVPVDVDTTGLKFVMASNTNVAREGHVHYTLDDRPFIMSVTPDAELEDVAPGEHTLVAELVQNNTRPFDPPVRQEITFIAE